MSHHRNTTPPEDPRLDERRGGRWREPDGLHLDVRDMVPPEPMLAILRLIDHGHAAPFTVHHDRDPIFLYPELEERGWAWTRIAGEPGEVRLRLEPRQS